MKTYAVFLDGSVEDEIKVTTKYTVLYKNKIRRTNYWLISQYFEMIYSFVNLYNLLLRRDTEIYFVWVLRVPLYKQLLEDKKDGMA